jgi:hypothetical protein
MYQVREKLAYSVIGKAVATLLRNAIYKRSRVHWVQQAFADCNFSKLCK